MNAAAETAAESALVLRGLAIRPARVCAPLAELTYGQSITDKCLSWQITEALLRELAQAVGKRRWK